jgi:predicted nucleotidyltransferase
MIATGRDLELILERILTVADPEVVYLFGSHGRGEADDLSDIDLLIVEKSTLPRQHRGKRVIAEMRGFPASFDLLFYTPAELADELGDPRSFASIVTASGRIIYERAAACASSRCRPSPAGSLRHTAAQNSL